MANNSATILDVVKKAQDAEAYRDSVNAEYRKLKNLLSLPPDEAYDVHGEKKKNIWHKVFESFRNPSPEKSVVEGNSHNAIDELIFLNELQQIGKPSTGNLEDIVGTIGPVPEPEVIGGYPGQELGMLNPLEWMSGAGSIRTGKGIMSILKNLLGKAKSKWKFPVGHGEPTKNVAKEYSKSFTNYLEQHETSMSNLRKNQGNIQKLLKEYDEVYGALEKPKGMRQFGKFNRPLGKYGNKPK